MLVLAASPFSLCLRACMTDQRMTAFRHLLYWATLETRMIKWRRMRWWNPWSVRSFVRECRYVGNLADAMHNLALAAASDFADFREDWFCSEMDSLAEKFPTEDRYNYRGFSQTIWIHRTLLNRNRRRFHRPLIHVWQNSSLTGTERQSSPSLRDRPSD